jgi:hypothetical protein
LVQAVHHWRPYLWGRAFIIKTDYFSLKFVLDQHLAMIPQHQWANKLIGFDLPRRIPTKREECGGGRTVSLRHGDDDGIGCHLGSLLRRARRSPPRIATDLALQVLQKQVRDGEKGNHWRIVDDLITSHDRVFVLTESLMLPGLLAHAHGCGHEGTEKTLHMLDADF